MNLVLPAKSSPRTRAHDRSPPLDVRRRLPAFIALKTDAVPALASIRALLIGAGSIGGRIAEHLARLQVGGIAVVDPATYKPESLLTQPIGPRDIGRSKARVIAKRCRAIAPAAQVRALAAPLDSIGLDVFASADVTIAALDNHRAVVELCARCPRDVPVIIAAVHGETLTAQVRCYSGRPGSACPACRIGTAERAQMLAEASFPCDGTGAADLHATPTMSISALCAIAADMAVIALVRSRLGLGRPIDDQQLEFNGYTFRTAISPLTPAPACTCDHDRFARVTLPGTLASRSLRDIAAAAGINGDEADTEASYRVDGYVLADHAACACRAVQGMFLPAGGSRCRRCRGIVAATPFGVRTEVPASCLSGQLRRPLHRLGARRVAAVVVRGRAGRVLVTGAPATDQPANGGSNGNR